MAATPSPPWPAILPVRAVRVARPTDRLDAVVAFYRDGLGLAELDRFDDHAGYSGVILGLPGAEHHLEFTQHAGGSPGPAPTGDNLLVLYFDGRAGAEAAARRLAASGHSAVEAENPYWTEHGAVTVEDPDGWRVVLMPEPFGGRPPATVTVEPYVGDRAALRPLFELAEDSAAALDAYLHLGHVLVAKAGAEIVGHVQWVHAGGPGPAEITTMAVREDHQGRGVGRRLLEDALARLAAAGVTSVRVATAAADTGTLRFYQRLGFRLRSVERDAFTEAGGYPEGIVLDGIPLRDRVWLDLELGSG